MLRNEFVDAKRIVIKLGTNVLRNADGEVAISRIYSFIEDMSKLVKQGKEVILVTSGAVGLGKKKLNLANEPELSPLQTQHWLVRKARLLKQPTSYMLQQFFHQKHNRFYPCFRPLPLLLASSLLDYRF